VIVYVVVMEREKHGKRHTDGERERGREILYSYYALPPIVTVLEILDYVRTDGSRETIVVAA